MSDDYRCATFAEACQRGGNMAASGGWHVYVVKREEIRGLEEFAAITSHEWRDAKRYGWTRVLEMTSQFVDPAGAA